MTLFVRLIFILMLIGFGSAAAAQDREVKLQLGVGVICNSPEQIERYLVLIQGDDSSSTQALHTVNHEAENPIACGVATIAFVPDILIRTHTISNHIVKVMRVKIVGIPTENGWRQIEELFQFTAFVEKAEEV
jgi:hypothetical protein